MRILRAEIWACADCTVWLCNGDASGMSDERAAAVMAACEAQGDLSLNIGDDNDTAGNRYDHDECEICGEESGLDYTRFAELGEGPEELDHDGARKYPVANPSDHDATYKTKLFLMWACPYASEHVWVWADHFEDAFEVLVEWLDDNAPGCLTRIDWDETAREHGYENWQAAHDALGEGEELDALVEEAESDLSIVGHTTLKNGDAIASDEWGGGEEDYEPLVEAVRLHGAMGSLEG